ncbi:MAG: hypothetical protein MK171_08890 [Pirellulales bacterium]|nr:hypothetical protein [Pirellulales bacterium]
MRYRLCLRKTFTESSPAFLLVLTVLCCSGATCVPSLRNPFIPIGPPAPEVLTAGASLEQVIAAVNHNSARVQSYQTEDASISVHGLTGVPALRGHIAMQRPSRLRLVASAGFAFAGREFDLGSNDELFWFWVKRNDPPAFYFSRHDQFVDSAAQQVMPIDPQWLIDALGLSQFSTSDQHEGPLPRRDGTLEIRSMMQTRTGQMTKSTVIDSRRAWVLEQHIYDASGALLASATARSHRYYPELGASLPQTVDINLPAAQLALSIDVGTVRMNTLSANSELWSLPAISGYPQIDLGSAPSGSIPAIGRAGSNDWSTGASPAIVGIIPGAAAIDPSTSTQAFGVWPQPVGVASANPADRRREAYPLQTMTVEIPTSEPRTQALHPAGVELGRR